MGDSETARRHVCPQSRWRGRGPQTNQRGCRPGQGAARIDRREEFCGRSDRADAVRNLALNSSPNTGNGVASTGSAVENQL